MRWFRKPVGEIPNRFNSCTLRNYLNMGHNNIKIEIQNNVAKKILLALDFNT